MMRTQLDPAMTQQKKHTKKLMWLISAYLSYLFNHTLPPHAPAPGQSRLSLADFDVNPSPSPPNNNTRHSALEVAFEGHSTTCQDARKLLEKNKDAQLVTSILKHVNVTTGVLFAELQPC